MSRLPIIGITMGDPSGIGPEIILKALSDPGLYEICRPLVIGDPGSLSTEFRDLPKTLLEEVSAPGGVKGVPGRIEVMPLSRLKKEDRMPGKSSLEGGKAMVNYITRAVELAQSKELAAMVTCPISKALMNEAGYRFEGHTQLIAHLTQVDNHVMMLAGDRLRVTLVTIHCALRDVPACIDEDKIYRTIEVTEQALKKDFGIQSPRIAVAALNPHAGESGLFGSEEGEFIVPAIKRAAAKGCNVEGPLPADTLYVKAAAGMFDAVVNMYHDQGLIPLKLLHFSEAVNITLGLPIVRTSVDHGTAYDIAGKGEANPASLRAAIKMAAAIAKNRDKFEKSLRH